MKLPTLTLNNHIKPHFLNKKKELTSIIIKVKTPRVNPTKSHQNSPANSVSVCFRKSEEKVI